jgi:DNA-binding transcriptional regulator YbjK
MTRVSFSTWQFVRLMVRLEETSGRHPARERLYEKWRQDWTQLDAELERLRAENFSAFSELMMEHDVTFDEVDGADLAIAADTIDEVASLLGGTRKSDGRARRKDIDYEAKELLALAKALRQQMKAQSKD